MPYDYQDKQRDASVVREYLSEAIANLNTVHFGQRNEFDKRTFPPNPRPSFEEAQAARRLAKDAMSRNETHAIALLSVAQGKGIELVEDLAEFLVCAAVEDALDDVELSAIRESLKSDSQCQQEAELERPSQSFTVLPLDQSTEDAKPYRFNPAEWILVGTKETTNGWCGFEMCPEWSDDDSLYTNSTHSAFLLIRVHSHFVTGLECGRYYKRMGNGDLAAWVIDADLASDGPLGELLEECTLSPTKAMALFAPLRPRWKDGILYVGDVRVTRVAPKAKNLRPILDAFEEEGWSERIDDPFPAVIPTLVDDCATPLKGSMASRKRSRFSPTERAKE